jgi:D-alanyl-D-alanine-carboxypeptidase/D-alanyl-D-alanine-endopeptidase
MRAHWPIAAFCLLLTCATQARSEDTGAGCRAGDAGYAAIDPIFDAFLAEKHVPGMIYGIVKDGKLVHCRAIGMRNVTTREPVDFDTVFRIASMTKSFTALAVLKLRDAGQLSLESPASRIVPELAGTRYPDVERREIRVRDLLAHTGGFVTDDPWGDRQLAMPDAEFSKNVSRGVPLARMPGVAYEYSNHGYALLGRVVTNASGTRYQDYVRREILAPLGMRSSGWEVADIEPVRRAIGYRYEDGAWREEPVLGDGAYTAMGGLHTTARDYVHYVDFLLSAWISREGAGAKVLSKGSRREITQGTSFPTMNPADPTDPGSCASASVYGMGMISHADCRFSQSVTHSGGLPGYGSNVLLLPEYDVGLFAFANRTYAPTRTVVRRAAARLKDLGVISAARREPSDALRQAEAAVTKIYDASSVRAAEPSLADNLLLDRSAEKRDTELRALRATLGACRHEARADVKHAQAATFRFPCERGTLEAAVTLAPTLDTKIQILQLTAGE